MSVTGDGGGDGGSGGADAGRGGLNARRYELEGRRNESIAALAPAATLVLAQILHNNIQRSDFPQATGESPGIPSTRVAERGRSNIA